MPLEAELHREAERQLAGVGDTRLGEWHEWSGRVYHIRRRLTPAEQRLVGDVKDIRRTPEAWERASRVGWKLRLAHPDALAEELGAPPKT